uniref:Bm10650 n=1 Tax=Brugia malayi TaxID=6279 RepID=A0A0J9Y8A7_BRUMA|nr:Bm10650 [Brugia malayi]
MMQPIWFSVLLCIVLAENGTISPLNLDIDDITWDDCSNGYFSTSFNILDNSNLESILGSSIDAHKRESENTGRELPGTSARNLEISISSDFSHFDFTDLWKSEHRSNEDSKIETVPITTGNYQLQELSRTDGENMHSISPDSLQFIDKKNYECPHVGCTMKTKNRKEYITHKKTHPKPFIYECKMFGCGRTFDNAASLCTHMQRHRPKLQCRDCGKFFTYMNNLYTHRKSCAKVPHKKNYECPHVGCTMETENYSEYIAHRRTHPKPFIYECRVPGCGRTFSNPSTLVNHQEIHGPRSHCGNCGKIFNYRKNLSPHRQCCTKASC